MDELKMLTVKRNGCTICANGNDLPEGEYCRACGFVEYKRRNPETIPKNKLKEAVKSARGYPEPIPFTFYA